ncbi:Rieske 2Fe-2S domain-containing protein [Pseudoduganella namucuonensis]|uniref:Assimilatory nitrite reductase (NAD(P)H) small subunit n=1 Tax=Pseudoduganella namucuonensis TaxID=1035707 RepID=A0A1I7FU29_9BURK|nr:Rieske 2Fe-2S domain-containing protein [Pseudoduganella namucuonensis]SFU39719.1 assimilatory nitrite reductase (NAD(P)H) small subunit [Pseudoduganella namucuonensis]
MAEHWKLICKLKDIPPEGARLVPRGFAWQELPGVAVFRTAGDKVFALLDSCPHNGGPLSQGKVLGEQVCCPRHQWSVELETGCLVSPEEHGCARRYAVRIEDEKIYLDLNELNAPASRAEAALAGAFGVAPHVGANPWA